MCPPPRSPSRDDADPSLAEEPLSHLRGHHETNRVCHGQPGPESDPEEEQGGCETCATEWRAKTARHYFFVPETATLLLLSSGLAGLAGVAWERRREK